MRVKLGPSPEATIAIDDRGIIVAWNPAAQRLLGWKATEAIGKQCHQIMHGLTPAGAPLCSADCAIVQLCRDGTAGRRFEMVARRSDGSEVWLDVATVLVDDGRPVAVHVLSESVAAKRLADVATEVAQRLGAGKPGAAAPDERARQAIHQALTPREIEVLRLLAAGVDTDAIGRRLHLSRNTVRNHVQNLLPKLGLHSRIEAVVLALRAGLVHLH